MPIINGEKFTCASCKNGHRTRTCNHEDRFLFRVNKPGRPAKRCTHLAWVVCNCLDKSAKRALVAIPKDLKCQCSSPRLELNGTEAHEPGCPACLPGENEVTKSFPSLPQATLSGLDTTTTTTSIDATKAPADPESTQGSGQAPNMPAPSDSVGDLSRDLQLGVYRNGRFPPPPDFHQYGRQSMPNLPFSQPHVPYCLQKPVQPTPARGLYRPPSAPTDVLQRPPTMMPGGPQYVDMTAQGSVMAGNGIERFSLPSAPGGLSHPHYHPSGSNAISTCCDAAIHTEAFASSGLPSPRRSEVSSQSSHEASRQTSWPSPDDVPPPWTGNGCSVGISHGLHGSSHRIEPTQYYLHPSYASFNSPLSPSEYNNAMEMMRLENPAVVSASLPPTAPATAPPGFVENGGYSTNGTIHECACGPGCSCLGCIVHAYNGTTTDYVRSAHASGPGDNVPHTAAGDQYWMAWDGWQDDALDSPVGVAQDPTATAPTQGSGAEECSLAAQAHQEPEPGGEDDVSPDHYFFVTYDL